MEDDGMFMEDMPMAMAMEKAGPMPPEPRIMRRGGGIPSPPPGKKPQAP